MLTGFGYVLDGKVHGLVQTSSDLSSPINYDANLTLARGLHTLQVYAKASGCVVSGIGLDSQYFPITGWSDIIYFETFPTEPTVVLQPLEINGTSLSLNFTVDEPVEQITYSMDNQSNVSIAGNATLTNLPYGDHNFTIYVTNQIGNIGVSQTLKFTIVKPEAFPVVPVAAVFVAVALRCLLGCWFTTKNTKIKKIA